MKRYSALIIILLLTACEGFVQVDLPDSQIGRDAAFSSNTTAIAAANAMYVAMLRTTGFVGGVSYNITLMTSMASDEVANYRNADVMTEIYTNEITPGNGFNLAIWTTAYNTIYESNAVLEGATQATNVSDSVRNQLMGEAYFVRAFTHFYLVNLFGAVPLITSTDYRINAVMGRTPETNVYQQIVTDLTNARALLKDAYFTAGRARPNRLAATALLARVKLYQQEYTEAEALASEVIASSSYVLEPLNTVFLKQSREAIWQLPQTLPNSTPTGDAILFIIRSNAFQNAMTGSLYSAFESGDARRTAWTQTWISTSGTFPYAAKYKEWRATNTSIHNEYLIPLRLAEQFLIRAEARAHIGDDSGAISDLDQVRTRTTLPLISVANPDATGDELLDLIAHERRIELFCEMGHRWFDLKRTGRAQQVLAPIKQYWNIGDELFPIPDLERQRNPALDPQNPGY